MWEPSLTRIQPTPPALESKVFNHWAARKVPTVMHSCKKILADKTNVPSDHSPESSTFLGKNNQPQHSEVYPSEVLF